MSTKALFIMGLIFVIVAGYFYASNDASLTRLNLKPSDIDYQASDIQALQTNEQGSVSYQLNASSVTHYQNAKTAVLTQPTIAWQTNNQNKVTLTADTAQLDEAKQLARLSGNVTMTSQPTGVTDGQANLIKLTGQDFVGNLKTKQVVSEQPLVVEQGNSRFEAKQVAADVATGDYTFNKIDMTFTPAQN